MRQLEYTLKFLTPAFLGNAEQIGQWRTPPFKALLRQWWRVAVAEELNFNVTAIRQREADLFGVAADGSDSHKSLLRIRLSHWGDGKLKSWESTGSVTHPEVGRTVGSDLYLGYGPLMFEKGKGTKLKANAAIQSGEQAILKMATPDHYAGTIEQAVRLINLYGAVGGRSRNAWGSLSLSENFVESKVVFRDWKRCLQEDWAHAIGSDEKPLIWRTASFKSWPELMKELAKIKIALRTHFTFNSGKNAPRPEARHWLSYPVTNHSVARWGNNARLPNSLRFKVRQDEAGKLYGVIFHMPCKPPREFEPDIAVLENLWQQVHQLLDNEQTLNRISE